MAHIYAEALGWLADGKKVLGRFRGGDEGKFPKEFNPRSCESFLVGMDGWEFRLKPRTVKIGNREVEAPVLEHVEGRTLWICAPTGEPERIEHGAYHPDSYVALRVKNGQAFASPEATVAAYEAFLALLRGEA